MPCPVGRSLDIAKAYSSRLYYTLYLLSLPGRCQGVQQKVGLYVVSSVVARAMPRRTTVGQTIICIFCRCSGNTKACSSRSGCILSFLSLLRQCKAYSSSWAILCIFCRSSGNTKACSSRVVYLVPFQVGQATSRPTAVG